METTIVYWGYIGKMEKKMETTIVYWGYIGKMEKKMETTIVYWGYIGKMEKKMETTIVYCIGPCFCSSRFFASGQVSVCGLTGKSAQDMVLGAQTSLVDQCGIPWKAFVLHKVSDI